MSEHITSQPAVEQRIEDPELARLGAQLVDASMRGDLGDVVAQHVDATGVQNPNAVGRSGFFVAGEVPMSNDNVYRQVGAEAIKDLATSGVVRNGVTAGSVQRRWGNRVFWHPGESGKKIATGGRMVIAADRAAAETGWVPADKVTGVYARDIDGSVKNILPSK